MTRAHSVLLAALIVCSAVIGAAGPALAQSTETATDSGPVTKTFETGPHKVKIDLFDVSSETTITVITDESPAGDNTAILRKTVSGSHNSAHFRNAGAYESFTVKVEGADGPVSMSKGGVTNAWKPGDDGKFLGDTGGDPGFQYELSEQIGESVMPQIVQLDRTGIPGSTTVNTTETDAQQSKVDIYQSAQNSKAQGEFYRTTLDNYLSDTKTQARIIGKNAYIRSLNKGDSKAAAKTSAKQAVNDYYSVKQANLIRHWNLKVQHGEYLQKTVSNESGISSDYITLDLVDNYDTGHVEAQSVAFDTGTRTVTLVNGTSMSVDTVDITGHAFTDAAFSSTASSSVGLTDPSPSFGFPEDGVAGGARSIQIKQNDVVSQNLDYIEFGADYQRFSEIEAQNEAVLSDMETLANNTYSAYQTGEINNSDLVDPYVLASQQSAGDEFQGWAASQLTLMGTNSPENFDQIGSFNISTESGQQYEGVLFSQENPASGQFENGTTYNPNQIGGTQYVVTSDRIVELQSNFTVDKITTTDGKNVQNVTIQKTTYETTNVTELKQQYEDLAYKRAQIEAREKALKQSAGGGLLGGGSVPPVVALAIIGTLLAIVVLQN
ncbi:hypothetical protein RBH20_13205 [Haloarcula sp. H-GB4]|uniref:hypothetical protein n=1 Tax=Haloarcula sp. H-GB4 TaxID=3069755 RepID=UPI0027B0CB1E|nr:hypothetical protein [Haloarcula sp. H-GB4]MDQ2073495.1 hypothetical protein [Haloarcula sp. H-GB4]